MKLNVLPNEFQQALPILTTLEDAGFEAYFVGGSVRDVLLEQAIHDVDIATSAFPAEVKELFPKTFDIGIEHGTVLVLTEDNQYEITTFRTESEYQDYRRPDKVEFVRSLAEDLKRRDFTINALALKKDGTMIDLFDGIADLQTQTLRAVGVAQERFHEDALRMMRGLRFVSQLGFQLEEKTFQAIQENHALLEKISVERIQVEFIKLLLGNYRNQGLAMLVDSQCYVYCPELAPYKDALLKMAQLSDVQLTTEVQAWTLLIDQLQLSREAIRPFLKAWKCSNDCIQQVQALTKGLRFRKEHSWEALIVYELGEHNVQLVEELMIYFNEVPNIACGKQVYDALPIYSLKDLVVNGNDLMQHFERRGGKWLKDVLAACEEQVVLQKVANEQEALFAYCAHWLAQAEE